MTDKVDVFSFGIMMAHCLQTPLSLVLPDISDSEAIIKYTATQAYEVKVSISCITSSHSCQCTALYCVTSTLFVVKKHQDVL